MRRFLLLIAVMQFSSLLFAQGEKEFISLLESGVREQQSKGLVYYADRIPDAMFRKMVNNLTRNQVNLLLEQHGEDLQLTSAEMTTIKKGLIANNAVAWPDALLSESKSVPFDSLVKKVESINRTVIDSIIKLPPSTRPYREILKWAFTFSRPVYLRNNELVIYYFQYYRSSSGAQRFFIHQRKNGTWGKPIAIAVGDF